MPCLAFIDAQESHNRANGSVKSSTVKSRPVTGRTDVAATKEAALPFHYYYYYYCCYYYCCYYYYYYY